MKMKTGFEERTNPTLPLVVSMTRQFPRSMLRALFLVLWLAVPLGALAQVDRSGGVDLEGGPIPDRSRQLVLVITEDWASTAGRLQRFTRASSEAGWEGEGVGHPVVVGRSGLGWGIGLHDRQAAGPRKEEGDGRAPAGAFRLIGAFGYADSVNTGLPYAAADADLECVDDAASPYYNRVLSRSNVTQATWDSHEEMRRTDDLYKLGVIVEHNGGAVGSLPVRSTQTGTGPEVVPAGGSCIFLHIWRGPGSTTAGCTAMPEDHLAPLMEWLDASLDPVFVQLPRSEYERFRDEWTLPSLEEFPFDQP